jgi:hypothetical protein
VLFDDAPEPEEVDDDLAPGDLLGHLGCLLEDHPEIGRGAGGARAADLENGGRSQGGRQPGAVAEGRDDHTLARGPGSLAALSC